MSTKIKTVIGPLAVGAFPNLNKPDTGGKYSDGKYKADFIFPAGGEIANKLRDVCRQAAKAEWPNVNLDKVRYVIKDGDDRTNRDGEIVDGYGGGEYITPKTKAKPDIRDAKKNPVNVVVGRGSVVKISITTNPCVISGKKTVALWLNAVQVLDLHEYSGGGGDDFDEEDGYEVDGSDPDETENETDSDEDDDDGDY